MGEKRGTNGCSSFGYGLEGIVDLKKGSIRRQLDGQRKGGEAEIVELEGRTRLEELEE
jgi:hypothetical protein